MSASWNTALYTSQGAVPPAGKSDNVTIPLAKLVTGKLRFAQALYIANGNEASNDTINIVVLKGGARVRPENSTVFALNGATANGNCNLNIGDSNNALRYANGIVVFANTAANAAIQPILWCNCTSPKNTTLFTPNDIATISPPPAVLTTNDQTVVIATIVANGIVANSQLWFDVAYVDE